MIRFLIFAALTILVATGCPKTEVPWPAGTKLKATPRMGPDETYPIRLAWPVLEDPRVLGYVVEKDGAELAYIRENFIEVEGTGDHKFTVFAKGEGVESTRLGVTTTKPKRNAVGGGTGRFAVAKEEINNKKPEVAQRLPVQKPQSIVKSDVLSVTHVDVRGSVSKKKGAEFVKGKSTHLRRCAKRYPSAPTSGILHLSVTQGKVSKVSVADVQDRGLAACLKQTLAKRFDFDKAEKVTAKISYRIGG